MEWLQFLILIISLGSLFFWNRSEANSDRKEMANLVNSDRREMMNLINCDRRERMDLIKCIEKEMRDFHARLCVIEERRRNL